MEKKNEHDLLSNLLADTERYGISPDLLVESGEIPVFEKYDSYILGCSATSSLPVESFNKYFGGKFNF